MKVDDPVKLILNRKGPDIWSVPPDASVYSAIELMADKRVGALLVIEEGTLVGIISERDYARKVILQGRSSKSTFVDEIMTPSPITVDMCTSVQEAMQVMTENRVRHLPVVENGTLRGVLSLGDLVNWIITVQDETIEHLQHYIAGQYPC